ncbi:MAG: nitroreductase family protein, partial [Vicinamibacterales bacterium]
MKAPVFVPLATYREYPEAEMVDRAHLFREDLQRRRTVREFSSRDIPAGVLDDCLMAAGTAPSGANMQPWHFVVITDPGLKARIRA